jgi:hypothetical protein
MNCTIQALWEPFASGWNRRKTGRIFLEHACSIAQDAETGMLNPKRRNFLTLGSSFDNSEAEIFLQPHKM